MKTLLDLIKFLIYMCDAGGAFRILYCLIICMGNPDEVKGFVKKIIHVLIFLAFANVCLGLVHLIELYF
jgi:hypothetical protein